MTSFAATVQRKAPLTFIETAQSCCDTAQPLNVLSDLSDDELQAHIDSCANLMFQAEQRYRETSCFSDKGDRDRWWRAEQEALLIRSARRVANGQVMAIERARGLSA